MHCRKESNENTEWFCLLGETRISAFYIIKGRIIKMNLAERFMGS